MGVEPLVSKLYHDFFEKFIEFLKKMVSWDTSWSNGIKKISEQMFKFSFSFLLRKEYRKDINLIIFIKQCHIPGLTPNLHNL